MISKGKKIISGYHLEKILKIYHFSEYKSNLKHKEESGFNGYFSFLKNFYDLASICLFLNIFATFIYPLIIN